MTASSVYFFLDFQENCSCVTLLLHILLAVVLEFCDVVGSQWTTAG